MTALSGQSCTVAEVIQLEADQSWRASSSFGHSIVKKACQKLGIANDGCVTLLYGAEVVPVQADPKDWPGSPSPGAVIEYQLVRSKQARAEL
mmetsp:Transcript_63343/g.117836  ORF Transcript_63343/g.117836 Transcript_63343/m.117836 type:complete len:92 (-) Transcript_63343:35-310(-)